VTSVARGYSCRSPDRRGAVIAETAKRRRDESLNAECDASSRSTSVVLSRLLTCDNVETTFDLLPKAATMLNDISSFRQSRNKLNMFNLFRLCRKNPSTCNIRQCYSDIVAGVDGALAYISVSWRAVPPGTDRNRTETTPDSDRLSRLRRCLGGGLAAP